MDFLAASDLPRLDPHHRFPLVEIAGDFIFLDARSAMNETQGRDAPLAGLGEDWWIFASSGTGDAWLVSADDYQQIAFLDHDAGPDATSQAMLITFGQWLQLADVIRQFEATDDSTLCPEVERLIEQISCGLVQRYPYRLEG